VELSILDRGHGSAADRFGDGDVDEAGSLDHGWRLVVLLHHMRPYLPEEDDVVPAESKPATSTSFLMAVKLTAVKALEQHSHRRGLNGHPLPDTLYGSQ
jgi:hypothetical protein